MDSIPQNIPKADREIFKLFTIKETLEKEYQNMMESQKTQREGFSNHEKSAIEEYEAMYNRLVRDLREYVYDQKRGNGMRTLLKEVKSCPTNRACAVHARLSKYEQLAVDHFLREAKEKGYNCWAGEEFIYTPNEDKDDYFDHATSRIVVKLSM